MISSENLAIIYIESEREVTSQVEVTGTHCRSVGERESKMTKIEAYNAVIAGNITEEVIAKFNELIEAHESESVKRKNRAAEKRAEKLEAEKGLEEGILAALGETPMTASDIRDAVEGIETPQKATVVVKRLVAAGLVNVEEVKGKSGKVKGYTLA